MSTTAYRTSISLSPQVGEKLQKYKNKSSIIEQSLELFFIQEAFFVKSKNRYLKSSKNKIIKKSLLQSPISNSLLGVISKNVDLSEISHKEHLLEKHL